MRKESEENPTSASGVSEVVGASGDATEALVVAKAKRKKGPSARVMEVVTDVIHKETGKVLLSEETILKALEHKVIEKRVYILHDKDPYTEEDEKENPEHKAGTQKSAHWHVVMKFNQGMPISGVAKWFGVAPNFIKIGQGYDPFIEMVEYLTHESEKQQALGKHLYSDDEMHANFDFRAELTRMQERRIRIGRFETPKEEFLYKIQYEGMSLKEAYQKECKMYMTYPDQAQKARLIYLRNAQMPKSRINFYVTGKGGIGKDLMSRALARALFPQYDSDEDIFFIAGEGKVALDGYDGQPVIIWSDCRANDLLRQYSVSDIFRMFDTHPSKAAANIKYGKIYLTNTVNIINGQEDYKTFLDTLAGKEDKTQSYRRFPFIFPLHETDFSLLVNRGYLENTPEYFREYLEYNQMRLNMGELCRRCGGENDTYKLASQKALTTHVKTINETKEKAEAAAQSQLTTEEDIDNFIQNCIVDSPNPPRIIDCSDKDKTTAAFKSSLPYKEDDDDDYVDICDLFREG